jgi:hypothetical protein
MGTEGAIFRLAVTKALVHFRLLSLFVILEITKGR